MIQILSRANSIANPNNLHMIIIDIPLNPPKDKQCKLVKKQISYYYKVINHIRNFKSFYHKATHCCPVTN